MRRFAAGLGEPLRTPPGGATVERSSVLTFHRPPADTATERTTRYPEAGYMSRHFRKACARGAGFSFVELLVTIIIAGIAFAAMVPCSCRRPAEELGGHCCVSRSPTSPRRSSRRSASWTTARSRPTAARPGHDAEPVQSRLRRRSVRADRDAEHRAQARESSTCRTASRTIRPAPVGHHLAVQGRPRSRRRGMLRRVRSSRSRSRRSSTGSTRAADHRLLDRSGDGRHRTARRREPDGSPALGTRRSLRRRGRRQRRVRRRAVRRRDPAPATRSTRP